MKRLWSVFFLIPLLLSHFASGNVGDDPASTSGGFKQKYYKNLYYDKVPIFSLEYNGLSVGHSIWYNRGQHSKIKAKYFAARNYQGSVYERFQKWSYGKNIISVCSGAFASGGTPVGLTIENGQFVNKMLDETMDGFVIVYPAGGIGVSDLDNRCVEMGDGSCLNLREWGDRVAFKEWAAISGATVFQTQLLAFDNFLQFTSVDQTRRERRMLALVKDRNGDVIHIVLNLTRDSGFVLYDLSRDILAYLKGTGRTVVALLNLDVGAYDIMDLYDEYGNKDPYVKPAGGGVPIQTATNLLVYYYDSY